MLIITLTQGTPSVKVLCPLERLLLRSVWGFCFVYLIEFPETYCTALPICTQHAISCLLSLMITEFL